MLKQYEHYCKKAHWSASEDRQLEHLVGAGKSHEAIALEMNRKLTDIKIRCEQNGLVVNDRSNERERTCLRCTTTFLSSWAGNRICPTCSGSVDFEGGFTEVPMSLVN